MKRTQSGFTLIELLVVVAIIAVLMAVLLPSLAKAREQSKTVTCLSKFREIGMMTMLYATETDGQQPFLPNVSATKTNFTQVLGAAISNKLFSRNGLFCCPTLSSQYAGFATGATTLFQTTGLSSQINRWSAAGDPVTTFKRVMRPSEKGLLFDGYFNFTGNYFDWNEYPNAAQIITQPAHDGLRNCMYFDFHVETRRSIEMSKSSATNALVSRNWDPYAD